MNDLLSNPRGLLALACLGGLVISFNLILFGLLRGDKTVLEEMSKWGKAFGGGRDARQAQAAQLDELHQRVEKLKASPPSSKEQDHKS
jgi:hypothetical protein